MLTWWLYLWSSEVKSTLEVKFHATCPRLVSEGYAARKKGEWSELNTDRDGGNGGDPQRLPQPANYFVLYYPLRGSSQAMRTVLKKCNAHVICHFNNLLLGTWHLSSKTLFRVPSQKKNFPSYIVKKGKCAAAWKHKKCLNHPMPSLTMNLEDPLA